MIGIRLQSYGGYDLDFTRPAGEPALVAPDSVSWRVFKNPVALFVGGIAAVLLELAEPRVRSGVWDHTTFRTDPVDRMQRTAVAAMITVYGPQEAARQMIAGITERHGHVEGNTPAGIHYRALEPELLDWVHATACFGFLQAYHTFVHPLGDADRDRFYAEAVTAARLYGATGAPSCRAGMDSLLRRMAPKLEPHPIVFEFLRIVRQAPILPPPLKPVQWTLIRAGVELVPTWARDKLNLGSEYRLGKRQLTLVRWLGRVSDRIPIHWAPPAQACRRLGLSTRYLYHHPTETPCIGKQKS